MGQGDFKLLAALGAWTGWQVLPVTILVSASIGAIVGGSLVLLGPSRKGMDAPHPLRPLSRIGRDRELCSGGHEAVVWWLGRYPA